MSRDVEAGDITENLNGTRSSQLARTISLPKGYLYKSMTGDFDAVDFREINVQEKLQLEMLEQARDIKEKMKLLDEMSRDLRVEVLKADPALQRISQNINTVDAIMMDATHNDLMQAVALDSANKRIRRNIVWLGILLLVIGVGLFSVFGAVYHFDVLGHWGLMSWGICFAVMGLVFCFWAVNGC